MAKTKQTARRSTGGKAPRKQMAVKAARRSNGLWKQNNKVTRENSNSRARVGSAFVDFEDPRMKPFEDDLWRYVGRNDTLRLRYVPMMGINMYEVMWGDEDHQTETSFSHEQMEILFGRHIPAFLSSSLLEQQYVSASRCFRLGLTESLGDNDSYDSCVDPDWVIEFIWLSAGRRGEKKGCYYAQGEGSDAKYLIYLYSLSFDRIPNEDDTDRRGYNKIFGTGKARRSSRVDAIIKIDNWCKENPGKKKQINIALSRVSAPLAPMYLQPHLSVPFEDQGILCMRASVCNGITLVVTRAAASRFWDEEVVRISEREREQGYSPSVYHFTHMQTVLRTYYPGLVTLDHVHPPPHSTITGTSSGGSPLWSSSDVQWILGLGGSTRAGVFVLRLVDVHGFKHAICIDARNREALIFDSSEANPMTLTASSFRLCCSSGDPTKFAYFDDMRLVRPTVKKKKSTDKPLDGDRARKKVRRGRRRSSKHTNQGSSASHKGSTSH